MSASPAVVLKALEVSSPGGVHLLGPIDLSIASGSHTLLVGPSGCGKTTLLRAIAGLASTVAGEVELFGRCASRAGTQLIAPSQRSIGFLFQGGALWPHMTVRKTLDFVLAHHGVEKRARAARAAALLQLVDLEGFDGRKPGSMSGGERQRLALARALAAAPKLLLLDEPLGPLDTERREALLDTFQRLKEDLGLTFVHVTHDPAEAARISDCTFALLDGKLAPG